MVSLVTSKAPSLPYAAPVYDPQQQNQTASVLRLYFNTLDNILAEVIRVLNYTGPFATLTATTTTVGTVTADHVEATTLAADITTAKEARATTVVASGLQGGNAVFNSLSASSANASLFTGAGHELSFPHISYSGNADQFAGGDNTPTLVQWDTTESARGFTLAAALVTTTYAGIHKIDYSFQFVNTDNVAHDIVVWLRVNGVDMARSATKFTLQARKSVGNPSYLCAYSTMSSLCQAGDSVGLWWATDKAYNAVGPVDGVYMEYVPAQVAPYTHPEIPAAIGFITYVSAPPVPRTRVVPIGVSGYGGVEAPVVVIT